MDEFEKFVNLGKLSMNILVLLHQSFMKNMSYFPLNYRIKSFLIDLPKENKVILLSITVVCRHHSFP